MNTIALRYSRWFIVWGLCVALLIAAVPFAPKAEAASKTTIANRIVSFGDNYLGVPYKYGASTKTTKVFDCSSFVKYVYGKYGITLPRTSIKQSKMGKYVSKANLRKGDLVFFSTSGSKGKVGHVAIYAGNGKILHTYGKPGVTFSKLNSSWWKSHYITARRVI